MIACAEEQISDRNSKDSQELRDAEIGREELQIPRPELMWVFGVKIGVFVCARKFMMVHMGGFHRIEAKACVIEENGAADYVIQLRIARGEAAMHRVMGADK